MSNIVSEQVLARLAGKAFIQVRGTYYCEKCGARRKTSWITVSPNFDDYLWTGRCGWCGATVKIRIDEGSEIKDAD